VTRPPASAALSRRGFFVAHRWLILRRLTQAGFLAVFLTGPLAGIWLVKGTLASSLTLDLLPLTDPLIVLQSLAAGHLPYRDALIGAAIVLTVYLLVGGRAYCAWVCPINPVADLAHWMRGRLGFVGGGGLDRRLRVWALGGILAAAALTGSIAWEIVNPVTVLHRALVLGPPLTGAIAAAAVLLLDFGLVRHGWCGHLCPVGAFYGLIGAKSLIRVVAANRAACNDCLSCFAVCPEPQVIPPALRGEAKGLGPAILSGDCTNCGRCIDVCSNQVFRFGTRFGGTTPPVGPDRRQGGEMP